MVMHYPRDMFLSFLQAMFPALEKDKFAISTGIASFLYLVVLPPPLPISCFYNLNL